jgi:hypothetical protein
MIYKGRGASRKLAAGFAIPMLIATLGVAVAFVLTLLFSLETRGKELVPQLTLVEQPA